MIRLLWLLGLLGLLSVMVSTRFFENFREPKIAAQTEDEFRLEIQGAIRMIRDASSVSLRDQTPWELLHCALGLGLQFPSSVENNKTGQNRLWDFFFDGEQRPNSPYVVSDGRVRIRKGIRSFEFETHSNQFLAYFAQLNVNSSTKLSVDGLAPRLSDLIDSAKYDYKPRDDASFTLITLAHYSRFDETFIAQDGSRYSCRDVLKNVLQNNQSGSLPCGGSHRLFALAYSFQRWRSKNDSVFELVSEELEEKIRHIKQTQLECGSINPKIIDSKEPNTWIARIFATGHTMEWVLVYFSTVEVNTFQTEWSRRALAYLADEMVQHRAEQCPTSKWYHALHSLQTYLDSSE